MTNMSSNEINIDLDAINKEIANMDQATIAAEVLKLRTQQKVQQKKNQGSDKHKAYQKLQQEKKKAMIAKAKELGIYDDINEKAEAAAQAKVDADAQAEAEAAPVVE